MDIDYKKNSELLNTIEARQQMLEDMLKELISVSWKNNEFKSVFRTKQLENWQTANEETITAIRA